MFGFVSILRYYLATDGGIFCIVFKLVLPYNFLKSFKDIMRIFWKKSEKSHKTYYIKSFV